MAESTQDAESIQDAAKSHALNLLLLTWTAGTLDGLSYIRAHVFTANMTGNLVLFGIHVMNGGFPDALECLVALGAFALGCVLAGFLVLRQQDHGRSGLTILFSAELLLLLAFAALDEVKGSTGGRLYGGALILVAAMALAVQSVTVRRLRVSGVATTFITGTITTSMVGAVNVFRKQRRSEAEEQHVALLIAMLAVYLAAVVLATVLIRHAPAIARTIPAALVGTVLWRSRIRGSPA